MYIECYKQEGNELYAGQNWRMAGARYAKALTHAAKFFDLTPEQQVATYTTITTAAAGTAATVSFDVIVTATAVSLNMPVVSVLTQVLMNSRLCCTTKSDH
jgi:hypothetical protein